ncbi:MAG: hypothetical protein FRX48_06825 [Lasallia pustulata]|uniref:CCHC-type domain-containing protein n=1 Tax=Lasallia pustulata TaxID=136370 RepID=A0A5M8PK66_9LECA|nr:MAG: hypothetical protein FRX48_06825 [Lasallia pustulata]
MTVMAIRINNCLYEQCKEKGQSFYGNSKKTVTYMSGQQRKNQRQKNNKYGPRPMEIDTIKLKKKKTFKGDCYNCGKKGHLAKDCRGPAQTGKARRPNRGHMACIGNSEGEPQQIVMLYGYSNGTTSESGLGPDSSLEITAQN